MNKSENEMLKTLAKSVEDLSNRMLKLEEALNKGRGAFTMFLTLLTLIGTALTAVKLFWK